MTAATRLQTLKTLWRVVWLTVVLTIIVLLAVANRTPVEVQLYPLPHVLEAPLFLALLLAFLCGLALALADALVRRWRARRLTARLRTRIQALEDEISALRHELSILRTEDDAEPATVPARYSATGAVVPSL